MSKKINFATLNPATVETLNSYSIAMEKLETLKAAHKAADVKLQAARADAMKRVENGTASERELLNANKAISAENVLYKNECKPYNTAKSAAVKALVPDGMYYAYLVWLETGDANKTGVYKSTRTKKDGTTVVTTVNVSRSYAELMNAWLTETGAGMCDNVTAFMKFFGKMCARVAGVRISRDGKSYVKPYSKATFNELFIRSFIDLAVNDAKTFVVQADGTFELRFKA